MCWQFREESKFEKKDKKENKNNRNFENNLFGDILRRCLRRSLRQAEWGAVHQRERIEKDLNLIGLALAWLSART
jgi:hypothetical protein